MTRREPDVSGVRNPGDRRASGAVTRLLARRRVTLGFVAAAVALLLSSPTAGSLFAGATIALSGELLRLWAAGHLEKGREVTASGPYRFTRHPLYLGSSVVGLGFAVAASSVVVAALVALYLGLTLSAAMRTEEAHLTAKFGAAYPAYRAGQAPAAPRRFSLARAVGNREHRAVIGVAVALALLALKTL